MDRLSSPEQMNDYLHVTDPGVWVILTAVILFLTGAIIWSSVTYINSFVTGTAEVHDGVMVVSFDDDRYAQNVQAGQEVTVGTTASVIQSVGWDDDGKIIVTAETTLADGVYPAKVNYRQTRIIKLLFN